LIDKDYLAQQAEVLKKNNRLEGKGNKLTIGLLVGGDAKNFTLDKDGVLQMVSEVKKAAQALDADILATTSRRTSAAIEAILKKEFSGHARCKLLVIANELNIPEAVGGILGLSDIIVVSAESISMVSEASSSGKYVIVCDASVGKKHRRFLNNMSLRKHICLVPAQGIAERIEFLFRHKPQIDILNDRETVSRAYQRILL
jgi:mitochondrial fission protein ELM1